MHKIEFNAPEYHQDGSFKITSYIFSGDEKSGWQIFRRGQPWLNLGPGYVPVKVLNCGVCATDLARHQLPFALPQITGHEVVGLYHDQCVAVEINASHKATNDHVENCPYCRDGLEIHCPDRLTLGIDRLPGGFSPWVLAPVNAIRTLPTGMSAEAGVLIEPFAAALKAVEVTPPAAGAEVAVLGPRRLGMLIIVTLAGYRKQQQIDFTITAVVRHSHMAEMCREAGADHVVIVNNQKPIKQQYDIVYDTTGKPEGFALALQMSRHIVHLKSTHGQTVQGLQYLTDMVINEQSIVSINHDNVIKEINELPGRKNIYLSSTVAEHIKQDLESSMSDVSCYQGDSQEMLECLSENILGDKQAVIMRFDFAFVTRMQEIDHVLRLAQRMPGSILKPTGKIVLLGSEYEAGESLLYSSIVERNIQLQSSRCGDFSKAIEMLEGSPEIISWLQNNFISHVIPLSDIQQAFSIAKDSSKSVKVVVKAD